VRAYLEPIASNLNPGVGRLAGRIHPYKISYAEDLHSNVQLYSIYSTMPKVQVHEHTSSYQAITTKSPHGFQCLKRLFLEYDHDVPNRAMLENLLARDFVCSLRRL